MFGVVRLGVRSCNETNKVAGAWRIIISRDSSQSAPFAPSDIDAEQFVDLTAKFRITDLKIVCGFYHQIDLLFGTRQCTNRLKLRRRQESVKILVRVQFVLNAII